MSTRNSIEAVKKFAGGRDFYFGKVIATVVTTTGIMYIYNNISVGVQYNVPYMQMDVDVMWEEDASQPSYKELGLHGKYNSNFQDFTFLNNTLQWEDGDNKILVKSI